MRRSLWWWTYAQLLYLPPWLWRSATVQGVIFIVQNLEWFNTEAAGHLLDQSTWSSSWGIFCRGCFVVPLMRSHITLYDHFQGSLSYLCTPYLFIKIYQYFPFQALTKEPHHSSQYRSPCITWTQVILPLYPMDYHCCKLEEFTLITFFQSHQFVRLEHKRNC